MSRPRVMFYVQHLMGIGHQRRAAVIARAMQARGAEVLYVSGGYPLTDLDTGAAAFLQLPPARAADLRYAALVDANGDPVTPAWQSARRDLLLSALREFRPDALLVETYPFGRGLLRFELLPFVEAACAQKPKPKVISSVRDILEPRARQKNQRIAALVNSHFDFVLVHADPAIVDFGESFPLVRQIADKLRYTGFVVDAKNGEETCAHASGEVVVSAGGGVVGEALLEAALRAQPLSRLRDGPWRILVGPAVEEAAYQRLRALAAPGALVERNRVDFASLLRRGRVSISQAGYNTLLDLVQARIPAVVVPFTDGRHREQTTRAELFERRGLVRVVAPDDLDPGKLAEAVDLAADSDLPPLGMLDLNGAENAADIVLTALGD